jgi:hypothetical protein
MGDNKRSAPNHNVGSNQEPPTWSIDRNHTKVEPKTQHHMRYRPLANAERVLITIVARDGRHLQRVVKSSARRGSVPVIGFNDAVTVTITGVGSDGRRGPSVKATAKRNQ